MYPAGTEAKNYRHQPWSTGQDRWGFLVGSALLTIRAVAPCLVVIVAAICLQTGSARAQSTTPAISDGQSGEPTDRYALDDAQSTFDRLFEAEQHLEAVDAGKLLISLLLQEEEVDHIEWAQALTQLASAQRMAGDLLASIQNYETAIEVIEVDSDRLNKTLIEPLWELSRTYVETGDLDAATNAYKRTLHVHRVNFGLNNIQQTEFLSEMSEVYFQLGDFSQADALQQFYVNLANLNYPGDNLLKLPAMYSRAGMLNRMGRNIKSQELYRRIIGIIERADGSRSLELIRALNEISDVFLYNEIIDGYNGTEQARRYLRRVVNIVEKHEDATGLQKADAHLAMGDFLMLKTADPAAAMRNYRTAWDCLSADSEFLAERDERFAEPVALNDVESNSTPIFWALKASAAYDTDKKGIVVVNYDVDKRGEVKNPRVIESEPAGYRDYIVLLHLRDVVFRPRFVDREPSPSLDRRYELRYSYRDEELPEDRRSTLAESAAPNEVE